MTHRVVIGRLARIALAAVLAVWWLPARPAAAADTATADSGPSEVERSWERVRALMKRKAWREALQELELLGALAPGDGRVAAYRALVERRLQEQQPFHPRTDDTLGTLQKSLREEEHAKKRAAAQDRAVQRQMREEQKRWDEELKRLEREEVKRRKAQEREQRRQPPERPQSRAQPSPAPAAVAPAPTATPSTTPSAPTASDTTSEELLLDDALLLDTPPDDVPQPSPTDEPSPVELEPVRVQAAPAKPVGTSVGPIPGTVEMSADHMTMSPERRLAIAEGHVHVVLEQGLLTCDRLVVYTDTHDFYAQGRVFFQQGEQTFRGDLIHFNVDTKKGRVMNGTVGMPPWHQHGQLLEHIAEGVIRVQRGHLTSCDLDPPHYRLDATNALVFQQDRILRGRHVMLVVDELPIIYLPWLSIADRQTPFYLIPGKKKPWEEFALMGYRYDLPSGHKGALKLDWRRAFGWGTGVDHQFQGEGMGKGLVKLYFNEEPNRREPKSNLPKGAKGNRYRALVRHKGRLLGHTTVITDMQKFSDVDYRKDLLFREEYTEDNISDSIVSAVSSTQNFNLQTVWQKRLNRFQSSSEISPQVDFDVRPSQVPGTQMFIESHAGLLNLENKTAHSDSDTDVVRADFFEQVSYALNLLRPVLLTPKAGVRQTYYTKDIQGGLERPDGKRDVLVGQVNAGTDASLKLFRIFPVTMNKFGLDINWLRHVLTPSLAYTYVHQPTAPSDIFTSAAAQGTSNTVNFSLENKLQTKREKVVPGKQRKTRMDNVDLVRFITTLPYRFHGNANKAGGRFDDWVFDLELFPYRWLRLETDWTVPSHFVAGTRDSRTTRWNVDLILVGGGEGTAEARTAPPIRTTATRDSIESQQQTGDVLLPLGQWYLGYGHRYAQNDKTDDVLQFDWRLSKKWQVGSFHRMTWKQVADNSKRFNTLREWQYRLSRDLHDWMAELVYHVDREYGEEVFLMLRLKAFPGMPVEMGTSYHAPKTGSQSSPFSPIRN